ncbi:DNA damage-regulated autophagy modulator protein 2-like [Dysidea avara]|uniref:DNA damage-regulated autophagy modulator protein 2-like n=1 Tax=Dysidea avara TaxID=196820 RepID=UPI00331EBDE1
MTELKTMEDDWRSGLRSSGSIKSCRCIQKVGVKIVPIGFFLVLSCGFITTYIIAVTNDDVRSVFPYISDTGNFHPESSLFTLVCTIGAIFAFLTFYIHYKHTKLMTEHKWYLRCNTLAFLLSLGTCFGLLLIASFQDGATLSAIHYVGAVLMFGVGTIYCCITTCIGWHIARIHSDHWLVVITGIRIGMCLLMVVGVIAVFTATFIADTKYENLSGNSTFDKFKWSPENEEFQVHMIATVSEWFVAFIAILFFLTFVRSFHSIEVETITVKVKEQYGYLRIDERDFT